MFNRMITYYTIIMVIYNMIIYSMFSLSQSMK